jgi:hypothetical protein
LLAEVVPLVPEALAVWEGVTEVHQLRQLARRTVGRWVYENYRRRPVIIPVVVETLPVAAGFVRPEDSGGNWVVRSAAACPVESLRAGLKTAKDRLA